jgi:hypothetical protein
MGLERSGDQMKELEDLVSDLTTCRDRSADIERRLDSLYKRYVGDAPLVKAAKTVRLGQEAMLEGLRGVADARRVPTARNMTRRSSGH